MKKTKSVHCNRSKISSQLVLAGRAHLVEQLVRERHRKSGEDGLRGCKRTSREEKQIDEEMEKKNEGEETEDVESAGGGNKNRNMKGRAIRTSF
eukprot:760567-Hanusia_phi.AAC.3